MIPWQQVEKVLVVRLRSIGDTVLATPSLTALRRFLPNARIDILLEDWVAPVLEGFDAVDNVIAIPKSSASRAQAAWRLRQTRYDVAINLHGGTTGTFFTFASGAKHRVGFTEYQYSFLYNHLLTSAADFWQRTPLHSAEQQLALLGFVGVPVEDLPKSTLRSPGSLESYGTLDGAGSMESSDSEFALIHPAAAIPEKQWAAEKFARIAEFLAEKGIAVVAVAAKNEAAVLKNLRNASKVPITTFDDLTLPEITALASKAALFVGNDSGIAHIAAAVNTPSVVIFGSSNIDHWRPWTDAPNEIVYSEKPCSHFKGKTNPGLRDPKCIQCVEVEEVIEAVSNLPILQKSL